MSCSTNWISESLQAKVFLGLFERNMTSLRVTQYQTEQFNAESRNKKRKRTQSVTLKLRRSHRKGPPPTPPPPPHRYNPVIHWVLGDIAASGAPAGGLLEDLTVGGKKKGILEHEVSDERCRDAPVARRTTTLAPCFAHTIKRYRQVRGQTPEVKSLDNAPSIGHFACFFKLGAKC